MVIINQNTPRNNDINPDFFLFSKNNNQTPIAATVKDKTALQLKIKTIAIINCTNFFALAANTAQNITGKAMTSE